MISKFDTVVQLIDGFTEVTGRILAPLLGIMLIATFGVVVLRYGFNLGAQGIQEAVVYLHATVFMLGFAYTLKHNGHVRVDILYQKLRPQRQAMVDLVGTAFLLLPMAGFILYSSLDYVAFSWRLKEGSPEPGGLPFVYLLKTLMPISAALILLQGFAELLRHGIVMVGGLRTGQNGG